MRSTIFTRIINGELPSIKIEENEYAYAFMDIFPLRLGHVLVVPKVEVDKFYDLEDVNLSELILFSKKIAKIMSDVFDKRIGLSIVGIEIPHAHVHLIPIDTANDLNFNQAKLDMSREEIQTIANKIKKNSIIKSMRTIKFREALGEAMSEEMRKDATVFLMGEEVAEYNGAYKVSQGMLDEFGPERVIDTPISELGFASIGVGAAMNGLKPIVEFMTWNFALLAIDQIINHSSKTLAMSAGEFSNPIVFRGPNGSAGQLGAQHSMAFESMYASIPGLKVISPSNGYDAKGLLKSAIQDPDPIIFMESELMYGDNCRIPDEEYYLPIGKADIKREGTDCTIISFNKMMKVALSVADELAKGGIHCEVIDLMTIRPLDIETIVTSVKKTYRLVVVEESWPFGSIASEISFQIQRHAFDYLDAPIKRVTGADSSMHYAPNLVEAYLPNPSKVIQAVKSALYETA